MPGHAIELLLPAFTWVIVPEAAATSHEWTVVLKGSMMHARVH